MKIMVDLDTRVIDNEVERIKEWEI